MPLRVAVYVMAKHRRSNMVCGALFDGITRTGDHAQIVDEKHYKGPQDYDACAFYGFTHNMQHIMVDYREAGKPVVYVDLGYWKREGTSGYHKISVNGRHPTDYFQKVKHDASRATAIGVPIKPWRKEGRHILLAGMGAKAANIAENIGFERFERVMIRLLRRYTDRPIVFRPKPSCRDSGPLPGTIYSPKDQPIEQVLAGCHAIVTHHSNVAVDGLIAGIPAFCWQGVAVPLSLQHCGKIEQPAFPDDRAQWVNDIAYTQWSIPEMEMGLPWRHLKDEGLVP